MRIVNAGKFEEALAPWYVDSTFSEDTEALAAKDTLPTEVLRSFIANWVVKYFYEYRQPQNKEGSHSLEKVAEESARLNTLISGLVRKGSFSMGEMCLFDLAKTAALVEGIYHTKLEVEGVGLDLGTGTGVLAHAAHIALLRNDIKKRVLAIDINKYQLASAKAIGRDGVEFLQTDSTNPQNWQEHLQGKPISLIVNENLPNPGTRLFSELSKKEHEPFFTNVESLATAELLIPGVKHFPSRVNVSRFFENGEISDEGFMDPLDAENRAQILAWHCEDPATAIVINRLALNNQELRLKTLGQDYYDYFSPDLFKSKRW